MQTRLTMGGDTAMSRHDRLALAEEAALKAIALEDSLGDAHAALGLVRLTNSELVSAEAELRRAVALEPNRALFREWLVQLYIWTERPVVALAEARRAIELDPLSPTANAELAHALVASDRCDEALAQLARIKLLRPPLLRAGNYATQCYVRRHMWLQAIAELQQPAVKRPPRGQALLGYLLARAGRTDEARGILASMLERSRRFSGGAFQVATVYAGLGEHDHAFAWLDRAIEERAIIFDDLPTVLDGLRPDARLDAFRRRVGLQN
jgi:tetratricopeptide (TPR) repeat protein